MGELMGTTGQEEKSCSLDMMVNTPCLYIMLFCLNFFFFFGPIYACTSRKCLAWTVEFIIMYEDMEKQFYDELSFWDVRLSI